MDFENIVPGESQTQKVMYYINPLYEIYRIDKSVETEHRLVVARVLEKWGVEADCPSVHASVLVIAVFWNICEM